jgi:hypothetical protein
VTYGHLQNQVAADAARQIGAALARTSKPSAPTGAETNGASA